MPLPGYLVLAVFILITEGLVLDLSARRQWDNAQGFCGETSIQTAALYFGAWISQTVVRQAGGTGSEILVCNEKDCNVATALRELSLQFEIWKDNDVPSPQPLSFFSWVRGHLDAGHPAIMCMYVNGLSDADYDHIVPVFGYESRSSTGSASGDRLLFYDLEESTPAASRFNVSLDSFVATRKQCNKGTAPYCLPAAVDYGVSILGPADTGSELAAGVRVAVLVERWDEPDVTGRHPQPPITMFANLSITGCTPGLRYALLRYAGRAPVVGFQCRTADVCTLFTAAAARVVLADSQGFQSDTAVHWRVIAAA